MHFVAECELATQGRKAEASRTLTPIKVSYIKHNRRLRMCRFIKHLGLKIMAGAPKGNANAVKSNHLVTDMLRLVVTQDQKKLRAGLEKILDEAEKGNLFAISFIADRLEGKPKQATEITGKNGSDLLGSIKRVIIDPRITD
jgi:hypothetical protein